MAKKITTRYHDSTCIRCGKRFEQFDLVMHSRPIGVWCVERCIPEFPKPEDRDTRLAIEILERLEHDGRLKPYTEGILERYRVTGRISTAHIESLLPQDELRRQLMAKPPNRPPRTIEDVTVNDYTNQPRRTT